MLYLHRFNIDGQLRMYCETACNCGFIMQINDVYAIIESPQKVKCVQCDMKRLLVVRTYCDMLTLCPVS